MTETFRYGIDHLTPNTAIKIARSEIKGILTEESIAKINKCNETVKEIAKGHKPVYAINTGFGSLKNKNISYEDSGKLQENLLKSHSVGVGDPIDNEIAKLMLILKVHSLAKVYDDTE